MAFALSSAFVILSCAVFVQADISHLRNSRYRGQPVQSLRLQRLESAPTPYPAAGYHPNREFNLPREQPLFPLSNQQGNRQQVNSGFDNLGESQRPQRPQLVYGSPEPRFPQQNRPQNSNGFNNFAETQQPEFVEQFQFSGGNQRPQNSNNGINNFDEPQQPQNNNGFNNGFNNLDEPQQRPELLYGAPNNQEAQSGFDVLSESQQRPQYNRNASSARLRQLLMARLQQVARLQQQTQSQTPQSLYAAPLQQAQSQTESQSSRFIAQKPARLTDNREEREEESDVKAAETVVDIETNSDSDSKKNVNQTTATVTPALAATGLYYPAAAFNYVQPFSASYVQPATAAYTVGSPFLPQQYALAAAPAAQLQAW